jgi:hypothetical protein
MRLLLGMEVSVSGLPTALKNCKIDRLKAMIFQIGGALNIKTGFSDQIRVTGYTTSL